MIQKRSLYPLVIVVALLLSLPVSARPSKEKFAAPKAQTPETARVIWETDAPVQRLALEGDLLWVGIYKGG